MYSYIHIPFCNNKCKYCRFASVWIIQEKAKKKYLNKLLIDINNYDSKINRLKSIYFWWWTPSILEIDEILNIIQAMKSKFWFYKNIEINLETTPNNITKKNLVWWKKIWINRISIWIQTLNNKSLQEIWRWNKSNIFEALDLIRNIWFENISIDFIIWLPYVSIWEIQNNINYILNKYNFIKHISVYMLEDYYEINDANNKFDKITYPNNWTSLWIKQEDYLFEYINIKNNLKKHWFNPYEISNFAKKWYECKHNKSYWNHSNVIAFGLWAHFFINNSGTIVLKFNFILYSSENSFLI